MHRFFMKDLFTLGLDALYQREAKPFSNSLDIIEGYKVLDNAIDKTTGKPNRDNFIWTGLARLLITAGDISFAAIRVETSRDPANPDVIAKWAFAYDLGEEHGGYIPFMWVYPTDHTVEQAMPMDMEAKATGPIFPGNPTQFMAKMGAYPVSVNPALAARSTAALNFILAQYLHEAGLSVHEHWVPANDTSKDYARYYLSDGLDHYLLDYDAPALVRALATIDRLSGRTEEDGAILLDEATEKDADQMAADNPDLPV